MYKNLTISFFLGFIVLTTQMTREVQAAQSPRASEHTRAAVAEEEFVRTITPETAKQVIADSLKPLIIDFYAGWCKPCQEMKPLFRQIASEYHNEYNFAAVNTDECQALMQEYRVLSIPTIAVFSNGELIDKISGLQTKEALLEKIKHVLARPKDISQWDQKELDEKLMQLLESMATIEEIQRFINAGANVNAVSAQGVTPLMYVIIAFLPSGIDISDVAKLLLEHGASTDFQIPHNHQKIEAYDYINEFMDRWRIIEKNCEKVQKILQKR